MTAAGNSPTRLRLSRNLRPPEPGDVSPATARDGNVSEPYIRLQGELERISTRCTLYSVRPKASQAYSLSRSSGPPDEGGGEADFCSGGAVGRGREDPHPTLSRSTGRGEEGWYTESRTALKAAAPESAAGATHAGVSEQGGAVAAAQVGSRAGRLRAPGPVTEKKRARSLANTAHARAAPQQGAEEGVALQGRDNDGGGQHQRDDAARLHPRHATTRCNCGIRSAATGRGPGAVPGAGHETGVPADSQT